MKDQDKTVEIRLRLWTNNLPNDVSPRLTWSSGTAMFIANRKLGVKSAQRVFNSLEDVSQTIQDLADKAGVLIVTKKKKSTYKPKTKNGKKKKGNT